MCQPNPFQHYSKSPFGGKMFDILEMIKLHVWLSVTPRTTACQASLFLTVSWSLHKFTSIVSVMSSSHLILCFPLLLLPSIFLSIRVSSNESGLLIRWPNYWRFSISPSKVYYSWFPLGLTRLISLQSKGLSKVFSNTTLQKHQFFSLLYGPNLTSIHNYWKNNSSDFFFNFYWQSNVSDF